MDARPNDLRLADDGRLQIEWDDGVTCEYVIRELRESCPCATCREQRRAEPASNQLLPILSEAEIEPVRILEMQPIGNYAYAIHFSDGHDTGIFQLQLLREFGRPL